MSNEKIEIKPQVSPDGITVLRIVEVQGLPEQRRRSTKITGVLGAPLEFASKQPETSVEEKLFEASYSEGIIQYTSNHNDPQCDLIVGRLVVNEFLQKFKINTDHIYTRESLLELIRFNRIFFDSVEAHEKIVKSLVKLKAQITTFLDKEDDNRGNKTDSQSKRLDIDFAESFVLKMPIFDPLQPRKFKVDIYLDARDRQIDFILNSVELHEIILKEREELMDVALSDIREAFGEEVKIVRID